MHYKVLMHYISIHALQAECDFLTVYNIGHIPNFYPRTPSGVRLMFECKKRLKRYFYPRTPSGVRPIIFLHNFLCFDFYPRTPSGVRPRFCYDQWSQIYFYPRTPSGVRLPPNGPTLSTITIFLSTHSKRSATVAFNQHSFAFAISIHALQAECDRM